MIEEIAAAAVGSLLASLLACVPGLHVYGIIALLALWAQDSAAGILPPQLLISAVMGMVVGYALINSIPAILFSAPDDSAMFTVLPGQRYLMEGRGRDAVLLTAIGGFGAILVMLAAFLSCAPTALAGAYRVVAPHMHWMVWCVVAFMLLSEWPQAMPSAGTRRERLLNGWKSISAGLLTFLLSGVLGFIMAFRSPIDVHMSYQNLMPAFVGLFTLPWLVLNLGARVEIPAQNPGGRIAVQATTWCRGIGAGIAGGGFAAVLPAVTGGIGGLLAGHAVAQRDDDEFLISQGAGKAVYYAGGFFLLFVPGLHLTRGGAAWIITGLADVRSLDLHATAARAMLTGCLIAFLLLGPLVRHSLFLLQYVGYRRTSFAALVAICGIVAAATGWAGLIVAAVGLSIGLIPPLFGCRRMNCLGVILLPVACGMSGFNGKIAEWLGLV